LIPGGFYLPVVLLYTVEHNTGKRRDFIHDEFTNAFPTKCVSARLDAREPFFWKDIHTRSAAKCALLFRSNDKSSALHAPQPTDDPIRKLAL
jgi:hypothetical protein